MPSLPDAAPRRPIHTRKITFDGFLRDDGLWDIDCTLVDTKAIPANLLERGRVPPGEPIHQLQVRLTVDSQFTIREVQAAAHHVPFGECHDAAQDPMQRLVGLTMGPGWRKALQEAIGGTKGCTHLRELVFNAATAAFQMIPHYVETRGGTVMPEMPASGQPPFYMGQCQTWAFDGPVVLRYTPQFARPSGKG